MRLARTGLTFSLGLSTLLLLASGAQAQNGKFDPLDGNWKVTLDGKAVKGDAILEEYPSWRMTIPGQAPVDLVRNGNTLTQKTATTTNTPGVVGALDGTSSASSSGNTDSRVQLTVSGLDTPDESD